MPLYFQGCSVVLIACHLSSRNSSLKEGFENCFPLTSILKLAHKILRVMLVGFLGKLDINYDCKFTCPICANLPHDQITIIMDGKEMGMPQKTAKPYVPPHTNDEHTPIAVPLYAQTSYIVVEFYLLQTCMK